MSTRARTYKRKPSTVKAEIIYNRGRVKTSAGWVDCESGDYLVTANGKSWVVEGDVFDLLYERDETT